MRRLLLAITLLAGSHPVFAETWFAAQRDARYRELFEQGADWDNAASHIQIFKFGTYFLHHAPEADLAAIIQGLKSRHIALGMEGLMLIESERCGRGVESYGGKSAVPAIAERVKRLGGEITAIALDSPVWFGNGYDGPRACHDSIEDVAKQLAINVRIMKDAFPAVRFGEIEPLNPQTEGRIDMMLHFVREFQERTGERIRFVHADVIWQLPWRNQMVEWKRKVEAAGIAFGVICNGNPHEISDTDWTMRALERFQAMTRNPAFHPDDIIIQSWMPRPTELMPESKSGTLMNLVAQAYGR
jgi:hypothetical protein